MIPKNLQNKSDFMSWFESLTKGGQLRVKTEFKFGLRDRKTGEPVEAHKDAAEKAEKVELDQLKAGKPDVVSKPKPRKSTTNKEIKA